MKWLAFISFIFLFSFAISRDLKRSARDAEHKSEIVHRFNDLKEETFKGAALITFAQYLYKCPYEEIAKLVKDVMDLAHKCVANEQDPECLKPVPTIVLDEICKIDMLGEAYGEMANCCSKADPERNQCFLSFKHSSPGFLPPYQRPEPEVMCKEFQENKELFMAHHIYEVSRRHPFLYAPTILALAVDIEHTIEHCCKEANTSICLDGKLSLIKERVLLLSKKSTYICGILKKFGERTFQADTLAIISQKFPKASFSEIYKIVKDIAHVHMECCAGDMIECTDDRAEVVNYICSKQDIFSSKIKDCCEKPVVERSECVVWAQFDDTPEGLPLLAKKYIEDKEVCKPFTAGQDVFMAEFLYEYSRRHPEFSSQMLLRIAKGYESILEECCKKESAFECYSHAEEKLRSHIQESQEIVKTNCDLLASLGEHDFQKVILGRYTRKMLQVSPETLIEISKKMAAIGSNCCQQTEARHIPCLEGHLSMVIQDMCVRQEATPINEKVTHCCDDSYADRRPCFTKMGVDESYKPPQFTPELFTFHEDWCTAPAETQHIKQLTLLVNLIKLKTTITDEQLKKIFTDFTGMVQKCCTAEQHKACFAVEDPKLIAEIKAILGIVGV
ncbi:albumin-like [Dermochelys coriacea]|uniref:albumin-like n=1 Tax=Dermochelys coriacea TaxID=27794 RepID=UPI0018E8E76D|nr:albumin-like [Dermochelys coriacea]